MTTGTERRGHPRHLVKPLRQFPTLKSDHRIVRSRATDGAQNIPCSFSFYSETIPALAVELRLRVHQGLFQQIDEDGSTRHDDHDGRRDDEQEKIHERDKGRPRGFKPPRHASHDRRRDGDRPRRIKRCTRHACICAERRPDVCHRPQQRATWWTAAGCPALWADGAKYGAGFRILHPGAWWDGGVSAR